MSASAVRPVRTSLAWTQSGRTAVLVGLSLLSATAPFGSMLAVFPACILLAFALSAPLAWLGVRGLRLRAPAARTVRSGVVFEFPLRVEHAGLGWGARDLLAFAGADGPTSARPLAWIECVPARGGATAPCEWRTRRRGRRTKLDLRLTSAFPLGWWQASAHFEAPIDWLSLPRVSRLDFDELERQRRREQGRVAHSRRGDDEFYALRDARPGDSPHWVHWRSSARRGKLVVRELRGEERPEKRVTLLGWTDRKNGANGTNDAFEHAVALTAALVERHAHRGEATHLRFEGPSPWSLRVSSSRSAVQAMLARLALVECRPLSAPGAPSATSVEMFLAREQRDGALLVHGCAAVRGPWRQVNRRTSEGGCVAVAERAGRRARVMGGAP
jgi:uncharacterized protein (DUF58 family)